MLLGMRTFVIGVAISLFACDAASVAGGVPAEASVGTDGGGGADAVAPRVDGGGGADASGPDAALPDASVDAAALDAAADADLGMAPAVRYVGRFDESDPSGPTVAWPGARAIVRFEGTALEATLKEAGGGPGGTTYLDVLVDGVLRTPPLVLPQGTQAYALATGLAAGVHVVEVVKRTEANLGSVQFRGFSYPGGGRLLAPLPAPSRRIELMGNSAIDGFGVDGMGPECAGGNAPPETSNARKSAGYIASARLGADFVLLGASGKGVSINITMGDPETFPLLFERTLPNDPASRWTPSKFIPDAFVLVPSNLDIDLSDAALNAAYENFILKVRAAYPSAHLFLTVSAYSTDDYPANAMTRTRLVQMTSAIAARRAAAGDAKVYANAMTVYTDAQLTGCAYHPGPALHMQMAGELEGFIRTRLGW
jgi:Carbohydrate esterase 2 N-terminal